jgi:hypothetical protein
MTEIECPICREQVIFPQGEANVFGCPECDAGINWDGKHIIGVKTNRNYLFVAQENFDSYFDQELFADAIDFANEVIDNDKAVLSELGRSGSDTITEESIIGHMNFDKSFRGFGMGFFVISLICGFWLFMTVQELAICLCMVPSLLALAISWGPGGAVFTTEDLQLAQNIGGSYREGSGYGFMPESSVYTRYKWKNQTFTFFAFKSIGENHILELSHFHHPGGDNSSPSQGYMWGLRDNMAVIGSDSYDTRISTKVHNLERENLVEDFEQILAIKNQLMKKTGLCLPIRIEFGRSQSRPQKIMKIIESDSELLELWKKLEEGK